MIDKQEIEIRKVCDKKLDSVCQCENMERSQPGICLNIIRQTYLNCIHDLKHKQDNENN